MRLLLLFALLFLSFHCYSQTNYQLNSISGILNGGKPIKGAHCFLKNHEHIGSVTDTTGYFHFNFQHTLLYDTLVISAIGFDKKEMPLFSVTLGQDTNYFYLKQRTIILNEVLVESKGFDLKDLVLGAYANIPKNYPDKPHQLKGLYRKVSTEGKKYTHLEEAAITIEDKGYKKPISYAKISTKSFRESKEWGNTDSFAIRVFNKTNMRISQELNNVTNPLTKLYKSNFIRFYKSENTVFNLKRMQKIIDDYYTFELIDISFVEGDTIYQIAFASSVTPPPPKIISARNYLKINSKDLAIVEMQFTLGFDDRPLIGQVHVIFEEKNGRYYPKYIKSIKPRFINRSFDDNEYDIHTFWFDEVNIGKFKKIKSKELTNPYDPESHKRKSLRPEFWKDSPLIKKYPLEQGIRKDLDKHQPLEEQFLESAQN